MELFLSRVAYYSAIIGFILIFSYADIKYELLVRYGTEANAVVENVHKPKIGSENDSFYIDVTYTKNGKEHYGRIEDYIQGCEAGDRFEVCFFDKYPQRVYELESMYEKNKNSRSFRYFLIVMFLVIMYGTNLIVKRELNKKRQEFFDSYHSGRF